MSPILQTFANGSARGYFYSMGEDYWAQKLNIYPAFSPTQNRVYNFSVQGDTVYMGTYIYKNGQFSLVTRLTKKGEFIDTYELTSQWPGTLGAGNGFIRATTNTTHTFFNTSSYPTISASRGNNNGGYNFKGTVSKTSAFTYSGSPATSGALIIKYNSSGSAQWHRIMSTGASHGCVGIGIDASDNVYAHLWNNGGATYFVKINADGTTGYNRGLTASSLGGVASATDSSGNTTYLSNFTNGSRTNGVVSRLDPSGTTLWTRQIGTDGSAAYCISAACDNLGNSYVAGQGDNGVYVIIKLDSSGTVVWQRSLSQTSTVIDSMYVDGLSLYWAQGRTDIGEVLIYRYPTSGSITGSYFQTIGTSTLPVSSISGAYQAGSYSISASSGDTTASAVTPVLRATTNSKLVMP